jgi:hypothetical protein
MACKKGKTYLIQDVINVFHVIDFVTLGNTIEDFLGMIYTIKNETRRRA